MPEEQAFHYYLSLVVLSCGLMSFVALLTFNAPYGRYADKAHKGWGPQLNAKAAWVFMECPTLWVSAICLYLAWGTSPVDSLPNLVLLGLFCCHYVNRALIFPLRMRRGAPMPMSVMFMAWFFCLVNGYLQARYLCKLHTYPVEWLWDPRFIVGVLAMGHGFYLNLQADSILRNLRQPGDTERYKIPYGGLFEYVSAANFCAEIYEWAGFALACFSLPAAVFAVFTFLNLAPRGVAHHRWYLETFPDYPKSRKAIIPFVC